MALWTDIDGEPWLDNPSLIIANPERKSHMARRRQPAGLARYWAAKRKGRKRAAPKRRRRARRSVAANPRRRRRSYRRNYAASGLIQNPHRRRRHTRNPRRRHHYRRNPSLGSVMGMQLPDIQDILFTGAGIVVPPILTSMLMGYLPVDWKTSKPAYYGVKAASVLIPSMLVRKFVSRRAGNLMLIGGAASLAIDLVRDFMPNLLPAASVSGQPFLGFYERMPVRIPAGNGMGRYSSIPVRSMPVQRTPLLSQTPERLSPGGRF